MATGDRAPRRREMSAETRQKLSELGKSKWQDPQYRARQTAYLQQISRSAAARAKMAEAARRRWQDPGYRARRRATLRTVSQDADYRARMSEAAKRKWQDPAYRAQQAVSLTRRWQDPGYRARQAAAVNRRRQDPDYRAKLAAARSGIEVSAETRQKLSAAGQRRWQDPAYRVGQLALIKRGQATARQNRGQTAPAAPAKAPPPPQSEKTGARPPDPGPSVLPVARKVEPNLRPYRAYLNSAAWQCPQSPGGAHYWIIQGDSMKCRYCAEERRVKR